MRIMAKVFAVCAVVFVAASSADAQVIGTFRWRTEPFCNILTLTVTSAPGGIFTLDGFEEQCGGSPRQPVHGIAVQQANGSITLGLNVVMLPAGQPVNIEAGISLASLSGNWRDSAGNSGQFIFGPTSTSGGPRGGPIQPAPLPPTFFHTPNGNFVITAGPQSDNLPIEGPGSRMMWYAAKSAFRAGRAEGSEWTQNNIGFYSAAFGIRTVANATASFAAGIDVAAIGVGGVAFGTSAVAAEGAFAFGDRSTAQLVTSNLNQFKARAAGGVAFYTNAALTAGMHLDPNGSQWLTNSDVNLKENFRDLDGATLLEKIARMPVQEWTYKAQPGVLHVGPMAQDFHAAFGLGEDPVRIGTLDADGINFAAVKALEERTRALDARNTALEAELAALRAEIAALRDARR